MDKEKEIEEMASIIYSKLNTGTYDNAFDDVGDAVAALQEAGYRKADEVRKETAKEILLYLKATITDGLLKNHEILNALMKKYGIEVDE